MLLWIFHKPAPKNPVLLHRYASFVAKIRPEFLSTVSFLRACAELTRAKRPS